MPWNNLASSFEWVSGYFEHQESTTPSSMLRLRESLGETDYDVYSQSISLYLSGRIAKTEFDHLMSKYLLTPERLVWHNEHILTIEASVIDYHQREVQQSDEQAGNTLPVWKPEDIKLTSTEQKLVTEAAKKARLLAPYTPTPITIPEGMPQEEYTRIMCPSTDTGCLPSSHTWMERIKLYCQNSNLTPPSYDTPARLLWLVSRNLK